MGFCGVDYIGTVSSFPNPDDKVRTESLIITGGGNAGNTACCIGKLASVFEKDYMSSHHEDYLECAILTKVGDDSNGKMVREGLEDFFVNTERICVSSTSPTGFVYVIVDKQTSTRTCIATPSEELTVGEVDAAVDQGLLDGATIVHFDSRHTAASLHLARTIAARNVASPSSSPNSRGNVIMTIDVEKDRPFLRELLPFVDIIFTNERFAQLFFADRPAVDGYTSVVEELYPLLEEPRSSDLMSRLRLLTQLLFPATRATCVVSTLGSGGSICVRTTSAAEAATSSSSGESTSIGSNVFSFTTQLDVRRYTYKVSGGDGTVGLYDILLCPAAALAPEDVVDSTGAGDVYIGGFIYGKVRP